MHRMFRFIVLAGVVACSSAYADENPANWRFHQSVEVSQVGFVRTALPLDTLSNAQASLADIRLMDPSGQEVSFYIDQPVEASSLYTSSALVLPPWQRPLHPMIVAMHPHETEIIGEVPLGLQKSGISGMTVLSETADYLKAVTVEGSNDRKQWTVILKDSPIYKQPGQPMSTPLSWPRQAWSFLRVTLNDTVTPAIRLERVDIFSAPAPLENLHTLPINILETSSDSHGTTLRLLLPADHLRVQALQFNVTDPTFRRSVHVGVDLFYDGQIRESSIAGGFIYRVALGSKSNEGLRLPVQTQLPGRQCIVHLDNGDSRPLTITSVSVIIAPSYLVFNASSPGRYALWSGNPTAAAMSYDVAQLHDPIALQNMHLASIGALEPNASYHAPDVSPELQIEGSDIDVTGWYYRKKVDLTSTAASPINQIALDLPVLTRMANRLESLRVVRQGKQIPYVLDQVSLSTETVIAFHPLPARAHQSRWQLTLPATPLMVHDLTLIITDPLFQRTIALYEDVQDERGDIVRKPLAQTSCVHTPTMESNRYTFALCQLLTSSTLTLEIDDGDNVPLHLSGATLSYPVPRLLFPAQPGPPVYLYYGQPDIAAPDYDLKLIADQILATPPSDATLGVEEVLKRTPWYQVPLPAGTPRWIFWIVMGIVVAGLLLVIAKLLPEESHA